MSDPSAFVVDAAERTHGGLRPAELESLGVELSGVVDFSVNVNPYGPSEAIARAIREAPLRPYPDPDCLDARRALGHAIDVPPEFIVLGHGATELLWTITRTLLRSKQRVLFIEPTFSEMRAAARAVGACPVESRAPEASGFNIDLEAALRTADAAHAEVVYLCVPGNPTGGHVPAAEIAAWAAELAPRWLVLDQAFLGLSELAHELGVRFPPNVICVRSLTKELGTPGLRVGYALGHPDLIPRFEAQRPRWTVSAAALAAVQALSRQPDFVSGVRERMLADRAGLLDVLRAVGLEPLRSVTPYCVAKVPGLAADLRRRSLVQHGVLIRDCASFGMPHHIRVCARPLHDVKRLERALRQAL